MLSVPTVCPKLKHKYSGGKKDNLALHAWHAADLGHCICTHSTSLSVVCKEKEKKWCYFFHSHLSSEIQLLWPHFHALPNGNISISLLKLKSCIIYSTRRVQQCKVPSINSLSAHTPKPLPKQPAPTWDVTTRKSGQKLPYNHHITNRLRKAGQELSSECRKKTEELLPPILKPGKKGSHREKPTLVLLKKFLSALFNPCYCSMCMFVELRLEFWLLEALRAATPAEWWQDQGKNLSRSPSVSKDQ